MNLSKVMAKLPSPPSDSHPPLWDYWRYDLWRRAQIDDASNFTKWPCIYHTMLHDHWKDAIKWEYHQLPPDWQILCTTPKHLHDDYIGCSLSLIHQFYHLYQFQLATGKRIDTLKSIYEFGGGFGLMAMACRRLGFIGRYTIYDLPEFSLLQKWYLSESKIDGITWVDNVLPAKPDLLIACYSLSEASYALRHKVAISITPKYHLYLYSNRFEEYDNIEYFQSSNPNWHHQKLDHLPPESWYSFGS